jgi:cytochrome c-type biogenesis protein CcmE
MAEKKFYLKLTGAFLLGVAALIIALIIFFVALPVIFLVSIAALGVLVAIVVFIIIWAFVYAMMVLGTAIYYFFKPMKVQEKGTYTIDATQEAGMREKGQTKKKKR